MDINGTQVIAAPRQAVWDALNDPAVLKACLPGCESVERTSPEEFKVVMAAAIGPLRARFNGKLRMSDVVAPQSCTMAFEGQGGAVGFGKGSSAVTLSETPAGTELAYTAQAQVGGKLAQVGSRLIDSVARKMADDFFTAFRKQLAPPAPAAPAAAPAPAAQVAAAGPVAVGAQPAGPAPSGAPQASASLPAPAGLPSPALAPTATLVPGWWLGVAAVLGAAIALAGVVLAR